jgi:hypothetical protein
MVNQRKLDNIQKTLASGKLLSSEETKQLIKKLDIALKE